jgi:hypothetical protein
MAARAGTAAVINTPEPLITAVEVAPASAQDGPQAKHLIDAQPPGRRPARVLGDTAYGVGPVRAEPAERDVEVLAPLPSGGAKPGRFGKRDFEIDPAARTVRCPAGQLAPIHIEPKKARRARFAKAGCDRCRLRDRCVEPVKRSGTVSLAPDEELLIAARQALDDPAAAEHLRRTRPPHRAATRPARTPLQRPQEPLQRRPQSPPASRLDGRPGQPQPDRRPPRRPNGMTARRRQDSTDHKRRANAIRHPRAEPTSSAVF